MLDADDLAQMQADVLEVISDHEQSIVIDRGGVILPAQDVRIERRGSAVKHMVGQQTEEVRASIIVVGGVTLDIQVGDRFNALGSVFEVTLLPPNAQIGKMAIAEIVQ
jgi:hypothetical protein